MRVQLRIVAGTLRGRKLLCQVNPRVRPTPQMVREAFFSILGNAIPDRPFVDLFAGTGVIGLEALSRGASFATFIERDSQLAGAIEKHLAAFDLRDQGRVVRADAYRWAAQWTAPAEPVNVFVSPPFGDFEDRPSDLVELLAALQFKVAAGSVLVLQAERNCLFEELSAMEQWEKRRYGRNVLMIWVKEPPTV